MKPSFQRASSIVVEFTRDSECSGECAGKAVSACFLLSVDDRSRDTLVPLIKQYILSGTTVISDQ
ncbi:hypothetical protein M514_08430 [Trichuris suis]|uniref:Uncharacterized protein n=1 Tax=Trichuris suis TaxID=68888 RepID=A0A085MV12_9BILA|nr:hypothetical protein M513_08430 [Trichuris suis]KFD61058.1 hypothetical protein M514_08430 [Trichuris suis]